MNRLNITAIAAAMTLAFSAGATAEGMSKDDMKAAKDTIAANYKSAHAACDTLKANAKDICVAEAKGKEKVAKAELAARDKPSIKASYDVSIAKAEAAYGIAKEKCDDKAGADKTACVKEAKAAEASAKADAKTRMDAAKKDMPAKAQPAEAMSKPAAAESKKETTGEYFDDVTVTTKVKAAILQEASLKSAEINVETLKGTVQLSGFVRSKADIAKAVEVAKSVKGVKTVVNNMILKGTQ